jgi:hypothetical protein
LGAHAQTGSELDEQIDDEQESDEFEGAPEIETHEVRSVVPPRRSPVLSPLADTRNRSLP